MVKHLRMQVKVKNNRLIQAREALGLTINEASLAIGMSPMTLCAYENLRQSPSSRKTVWLPSALKICEFYDHNPEYFWEDALADLKAEGSACITFDLQDAQDIVRTPVDYLLKQELTSHIEKALNMLTGREQVVIQGFMQDRMLKDIGEDLGIAGERVRQIQSKALCKLRHSASGLNKYVNGEPPPTLTREDIVVIPAETPKPLQVIKKVEPKLTIQDRLKAELLEVNRVYYMRIATVKKSKKADLYVLVDNVRKKIKKEVEAIVDDLDLNLRVKLVPLVRAPTYDELDKRWAYIQQMPPGVMTNQGWVFLYNLLYPGRIEQERKRNLGW